MIPEGTRVAVHYNFESGRLSVREILPSGALRALLAVVDDIVLEDCEFTCNRQRWQRWKNGLTRNVRQFAEIRGVPVTGSTAARGSSGWNPVILDPHRSPDFRLAGSDTIVKRAKRVLIAGRDMRAKDIETAAA